MPITVIDKSFSRVMVSPSESTVSIFVDWPARLKKLGIGRYLNCRSIFSIQALFFVPA